MKRLLHYEILKKNLDLKMAEFNKTKQNIFYH